MSEKISVIVPVYKVEKYLDKCVSSIVNQTYKNLEIILVDDGSPDNCPAMCDAWAEKDDRVKVIHKKNGGLSDARNAGMKIAIGEFIGFVDSDDWIAPGMYQHLYEIMISDQSDIAVCGALMVWEDGRTQKLTRDGSCVLNREDAMRAIIEESWLKQPVWNKLYRTEKIRDITFPVGKYHEDVFWSYKAVGMVDRVSVSDKVGYYYLQRDGSIMGEGYSIKRFDAVEAKVLRCTYVKDKFPELSPISLKDLWFSCIYQGQMALCGDDRTAVKQALKHLNSVIKCNPICTDVFSLKEKVWLLMARINFSLTCRIRSIIRIGL